MKTKFTLMPRRESNPQAKVFTPSLQPKLLLLPVSPHGIPYIFIKFEAHAGHHPCLRYFNIFAYGDIANLAPSVRSFKIRIPAAHSAFILSHPSLGLTLLPILVSCGLSRRSLRIRNLPRFFRLYLRIVYRLFPLRQL